MPAQLVFHEKRLLVSGAIVEMKIWRTQAPVPPSEHRLKYSLFYGFPGRRVIGYDNERGKGDHKHVNGVETAFVFTTVEALVAEFLSEVTKAESRP